MARPSSDIDTAFSAPSPAIGFELRARREKAGLSLAQMSAQTNLRQDYLHAIETLDLDALPSIGYVLGYVRTYADALGMDGAKATVRFKREAALSSIVQTDRPHFIFRRKIRLPRGFAAAMSVIGVVTLMGVWYGTSTPVVADPLPGVGLSAQLPVEPSAPVLSPDSLTLRLSAPSWVEIRDADGTRLVSRIFVTGESWQGARGGDYILSVRDAGAVELFLGAESQGVLGASGEPLSAISVRDIRLPQ